MMNDDVYDEKYLKSKMRIDENGKDSGVEDRDDNQVSRWEDLQRFLTNIKVTILIVSHNTSVSVAGLVTMINMTHSRII